MKLVFWQNIISPHQLPYLKAVAADRRHQVTLVAEQAMSRERVECGWKLPEVEPVQALVAPGSAVIDSLLTSRAVHIFSGFRLSAGLRRTMERAVAKGLHVGVVAEGADRRGTARRLLRRAMYTLDCVRLQKRVDFLLAIGEAGAEWYARCGFPREKIFRFGYVTEQPAARELQVTNETRFTVVFVGRCVQGKGIDIALHALSRLPGELTFRVIGGGRDLPCLQSLSRELGISHRVEFKGALPHALALLEISRADVFVLPSRFDGWGAVINEALQRGVPVICSEQCGARDLVRDFRGRVVRTEDVDELRDALEAFYRRGKRSPEVTRAIAEWSECLSPSSVGKYFCEVLDCVYGGGSRPTPPWEVNSAGGRARAASRPGLVS